MSETEQHHQHTWQPTHTDHTRIAEYACTDCPDTTTGCNTCGQPLDTTMATCERCIRRARRIIEDVVHDIDTVPFHTAEIMGLRGIRYDRVRVTTSDDDARLPFGLDRIVEDPDAIAQRIEAAKYPSTAVDVLVGWARAWADILGDHAVSSAHASWSAYLIDHTIWAAQNPDTSGWYDYLGEARRVRTTVRRLLGLEPEKQPAPCVHCGGTVIQEWTRHGLDDQLRCTRCGLTWRDRTWLQYANLHTIHELPATHPNALVTIADAKAIYRGRLRPNLLDLWVHRGTLTPAIDTAGVPLTDVRGGALYRLSEIESRCPHDVKASAS